ncbi:hypothetical protein [Yoonia litorea]|uniref:Uncharacterized protein n=1 Tax=Yoonia litorea TaxID=1123755 RepID=A0A1I6MVS7_9RHOB|nr:hypothetical protein [Yoonia litorea]SFS19658.1 hypothetical protein SAMN05444714_2292 [Yoonia litorea]
MTFTRKLLHIGATALMLSTVASVTTFVSADAAYAERGNNGNGNGRANRDNRGRDQATNRGQQRQQARQQIMADAGVSNWGAIASELGELNKANANANARSNSSDPIHQALGAYFESGGVSYAGVMAYIEAYDDYQEYLGTLIETDIVDPESGETIDITAENVGEYAESFTLVTGISDEFVDAYAAFAVLNDTRDEPLTRGAIDALNYMLGIAEPLDD